MSSSGTSLLSSASALELPTASHPFRFHGLRKGEARGGNPARSKLGFYAGKSMSNFHTYMDSASFANMFIYVNYERTWDSCNRRYRETAIGA